MKPLSTLSSTLCAMALASIAAPAFAGTISVLPGDNAQERLQSALIEAKPGDVIQIAAGRYDLTDGLSLDVDKVTIKGAGPDATILSFKGQKGAGEGLLVTSDDVVLKGFAVEDSKGDGIKSKGANRIVYTDLRVEWTEGAKETNGAYGIYPVESTNVLIDKVTVRGASDAGIYVGQSKNIIVRNSVAMYNVAGIEIENCYGADVYSNVAMHNTGGILVFDLPNLPQMGGHDVRIYGNRVTKNDTPNFAPKGNIVAGVPVGTGVMVMANRNVVIFGNTLGDNQTANVMLVAYTRAFTDKSYNPFVRSVTVRGNTHGRSGWAPAFVPAGPMREQLGAAGLGILWDGLKVPGQPIRVTDTALTISLNFPKQGAPAELAQPLPADLSKGKPLAEPRRIVLPASMEAATR
jgi:parallel beta-helix repeat protein